ncbi:DUF397 domain-containing protein [Micromonospora sp. NBC_01813]|uniref:DUF397 domain-containing protein n=1 Tax=Micromonospora sp. NBC_01813 TaxID=2975988 RepID=UPI002DD8EFB5|nr:DUF397 domain-containing protein [Micromonospora sp. NBC_01813]WSA08544.1 DUF397 domain-containing protein [Micromonospora sp. NBC_01813]
MTTPDGLQWRKSSRSTNTGGNCVEVAAVWRKSSRSGDTGGDCVEVAGNVPGRVLVRDSKDRDGGTLAFSPAAWTTFLTHTPTH